MQPKPLIFSEFLVIFGGLWRFIGERYKHVKKLCALGRVNQNSEIEKGNVRIRKVFCQETKITQTPVHVQTPNTSPLEAMLIENKGVRQ